MGERERKKETMGDERVYWYEKQLIDVKGTKGERCTILLVESENM